MEVLFLFALILAIAACIVMLATVMAKFASTIFRQISKEIDQNFTAFGRRR